MGLLASNALGVTTGGDRSANACAELRKRLDSSVIVLPSDAGYTGLREENWSQTAWRSPSCIAVPSVAAHVASVVSYLADRRVPFAIRSGGHDPNPFDSNIDAGILISLDNFASVSYDAGTQLATVGPGARWEAVYTELDKYQRTMVGGRVMDVGVGGLTLGSGLSYLTDLYGLACDNVVSYEVVLANGTIAQASTTSNSDLFWALKGGSNNFGVVTKFIAKTYSIYQTWGGLQVYAPDQVPALLQALSEYQTTPNKDPYANLIINLIPTNGTMLLTFVYLKPVERPDAFKPFYSLSPLMEQTGIMPLHQLMALFPPADLPRWAWRTLSFKPDAGLYEKLADLYTTAPEIATIGGLQGGSLIAAVQPIGKSAVLAGRESNSNTGNALGLEAIPQTWWGITAGWYNAKDDAVVYTALDSFAARLQAAVDTAGAGVDYIFMNDASIKQPVIASYGAANARRLKSTQKKYDADLVFRKLVPGGQKIPW
ncbi:hypothetical protein DHEL01_v211240 [Diaporthe helianthi]|uniref:FAD-binding PCMH-type domain-containing protein n=1 Tax=Diaporthe helianthi TaxID=158607 RepID=A0A2P5HJE0_DIAHE|nr:hypothetical protein DHEL01_v211240 [Diaporthe helianthi]